MKPHRSQILWRCAAVSIGLVGIVTVLALGEVPADDAGSPLQAGAEPVRVRTVVVACKELARTSTQPASVHPFFRAEIRGRVSGYVKELSVDIGDAVQAGQVLAVIDVPERDMQRKVAEARIGRLQAEEKRAEAEVELSSANVTAAEAKLAQAESELDSAEAALAAAEAEFDRTRDMVQRQSLQQRVLDEVRKKRDAERANKQAAASAIRFAEAEVTVAMARRSAAEADLKAARAETEIARKQLAETEVLLDFATLKAPFAGLVTERSVDPGDLVRESSDAHGDEPLFVVSQVNKVRVRFPVPERDAPYVTRGDSVTLKFPSFSPDESVAATVTRLAGSLDPNTRTMLVEAEVENVSNKLVPGMFGQSTVTLSTDVTARVLPARAVRFDDDGNAFVYALDPDNRVRVEPVTTGIDTGTTLEILSGVSAGQPVIDAHIERFVPGQQVAPLGPGV